MKKIILLFTCLLALKSVAQKNPETHLGAWYMYNGTHKVSEKIALKSMAHVRFFDFGDDLQQFIGRIGGNYKINETLNATLGYAYLNTDATFGSDGGDVNEHRVYEDLNIKHAISDLKFAHRLRAEQRFFKTTTGHFIRYQLGMSYPISNKWRGYVYDEIFFDFDGVAYNQNWLGLGLSYKMSTAVKLKVGYQKISTQAAVTFDRILLGIALSTNHNKKK